MKLFKKKLKSKEELAFERMLSLSKEDLESELANSNIDVLKKNKVVLDSWMESIKQFGIIAAILTLFTAFTINFYNSLHDFSRTLSLFLLICFGLVMLKIVHGLSDIIFRLRRVVFAQKLTEYYLDKKYEIKNIRETRLKAKYKR